MTSDLSKDLIPSFEACPVQTSRRRPTLEFAEPLVDGHGGLAKEIEIDAKRDSERDKKKKKKKKTAKTNGSTPRVKSSKGRDSSATSGVEVVRNLKDYHTTLAFQDGPMGESGFTDVTEATQKWENSGMNRKRRPEAQATVPGVQYVSREDHQQVEDQLRAKDPRLKHRVSIERSKLSSSVTSHESAEAASRQRCESPGTLYDRKMAAHEETLTRKASLDQDALIREQLRGREGFGHDRRDVKAPSSCEKTKYKSEGKDDDAGPPDYEKFVDDYDERQRGVNTEAQATSQVIASHGRAGAPDVEYGIVNGGYSKEDEFTDEDVAIAIAVDDSYYENQDHYHHAIEYSPDAKPPIIKNRRFQFYILTAMVMILICASILIAVPLVIANRSTPSSLTDSPTQAPSTAAQGIYREQFIAAVGPEVDVDGSPHDRAANWIMFEDPQRLTPLSDNLIQRYLLALFYFMTSENEANPWKSCGRPQDTLDTCEFQKFTLLPNDTIAFVPEMATRWLSNQHECEWIGITCDVGDAGSIVVAIDVWGQNLKGSIPTELSQITFLQSISLGYNNFTGTLPVEIAEMRYLVNLDLIGNQLTGTIPPEYWRAINLQGLNLVENALSGTISTDVGLLTNLKGLHLSSNSLEGSLPTQIGSLQFLSYLRTDGNRLTGAIPTEFGNLSHLQELWLHENLMSGTIPTEFGLMPAVSELRIGSNRIYGTIPNELWDNKTLLQKLDLNDMLLSGSLSTRIGELSSLVSLRVRRNRLTGTVPTEIALLGNLRLAWLHLNQFTESIPYQICSRVGPGLLEFLNADCGPIGAPAQECECCTGCCDRNTELCQLTDD